MKQTKWSGEKNEKNICSSFKLPCTTQSAGGMLQIELTTLTLRITEDSAKQMVNSLQLTVISMIGLLGEGNVSYVSPAHSEIF